MINCDLETHTHPHCVVPFDIGQAGRQGDPQAQMKGLQRELYSRASDEAK